MFNDKNKLVNPLVIYLIKLWLLTVLVVGPICGLIYELRNLGMNARLSLTDFFRIDLLVAYAVLAIGGFVLSLPVLLVELVVVRKIVALNYSWSRQRICITLMTMALVLILFVFIDIQKIFSVGLIYVFAILLSTVILFLFSEKDLKKIYSKVLK